METVAAAAVCKAYSSVSAVQRDMLTNLKSGLFSVLAFLLSICACLSPPPITQCYRGLLLFID